MGAMDMEEVLKQLVSAVVKEIAPLLAKEAFKKASALISSLGITFAKLKKRMRKIKAKFEPLVPFLSSISKDEPHRSDLEPWFKQLSQIAKKAKDVIHEIHKLEHSMEIKNGITAPMLEISTMWNEMDEKLKDVESELENAFQTKLRHGIESGQSSSHSTQNRKTGVDGETDANSNPQNFGSSLDAPNATCGPQKRHGNAQLQVTRLSKKARSAFLGSFATSISRGGMWNSHPEHQSTEDLELMDSMRRVKSANIIIGIDFTNSNENAGEFSFGGQNLHTIGGVKNPYEQVISIIGEALLPLCQDNLIHCFGFGNGCTRDQNVFSFYPDARACKDIEEVLERYRELVQDVRLAGPTSFSPIIEMAMRRSIECPYSILLIITDGQVTRRSNASIDELSQQEHNTIDAILRASKCPLSMIMVGVGDGPWDSIDSLQRKIPSRQFDNFNFVSFTDIMSKQSPFERRSKDFTRTMLRRAKDQYKSMLNLGMLRQKLHETDVPARVSLPPPSQEKVTNAMSLGGLESSNLIIGIDFTMSNEWAGLNSFNHQSLHTLLELNPYEQVISIVGQELSRFYQDSNIQCFGFGDRSTHDRDVFSFGGSCNGIQNVLQRYREIVPQVRLAGPKCFGPIIEMSMSSIARSGCQNTVLLIITNSQIKWGTNRREPEQSQRELVTIDAIVRASRYPLSIIMVGVGDGPWDTINQFEDMIPSCPFDNFKFVNFTEIMSKKAPKETKQKEFAQAVVTGISAAYKAMDNIGLFRRELPEIDIPERIALSPPRREKTHRRASSCRDPCLSETSWLVSEAMADVDLDHVNLILGVDFSKSNKTPRKLHAIAEDTPNLYEQVISIVGRTLSPFYNSIPSFGFCDKSTPDTKVFSFYHDEQESCKDVKQVLDRYRVILQYALPCEKGPKCFAPLIECATSKVSDDFESSYSMLLLITDGEVSENASKMTAAIMSASQYPLSIIMIGVGDGPWDKTLKFVKDIPSRQFYNFQFVNFTDIMADGISSENEHEFALKVVLGAIAEFKAASFRKIEEETDHGQKRVVLRPPVPAAHRHKT